MLGAYAALVTAPLVADPCKAEEPKAQGVSAGASSNFRVLEPTSSTHRAVVARAASTRSISLQAMVSRVGRRSHCSRSVGMGV